MRDSREAQGAGSSLSFINRKGFNRAAANFAALFEPNPLRTPVPEAVDKFFPRDQNNPNALTAMGCCMRGSGDFVLGHGSCDNYCNRDTDSSGC